MHQRAGDHASATGERFIFHAALVGADLDVAGLEHGGEIRIGAGRCECRVLADRAAVGEDVEFFKSITSGNEGHNVWNTGVDEMQ